jgi:NhaP-type Na+/H+ or K+/H+ antiporter
MIFVAGLGVLISTAIITLFVVYLFPYGYQWTWITGLLFGSILSTTDPVTIVTMLQDCGASHPLSSLNNGLVFMLFSIFTRIAVGSSYTVGKIIGDIDNRGNLYREQNM